MSPELQTQIAVWRSKQAAGTLTKEDMIAAVRAIRGDRRTAAVTSEQARRTRAKTEVLSADKLLADLGI